MRPSRIVTAAIGIVAVASTAFATSATASYHDTRISEVHQGVGDVGDYVELQAFSPGQNLVGGHYVITYDGGSAAFSTFQIPSIVSNAANQATILVANDATVTGADFNSAGQTQVVNTNGGVCFVDTTVPLVAIDCVRWGAPVGELPSPAGTPVSLPGGTLGDNTSLQRNIGRGCATALDLADDTNSSAADFAVGAASPRPSTATPTEAVCAQPKAKKCKKKKKKGKKSGSAAAKKKKCKKKKKKK